MNERLELYLASVQSALRLVPAWHRASETEELRGHLEELIAARQAAGTGEEAATSEALTQFGAPDTVAQGLQNAFWRARFLSRDSIPVAIVATVAIAALLIMATSPLIRLPYPNRLLFWIVTHSVFLSISLAAGALTALIAPRSAVYGAMLLTLFFGWQRILPEFLAISQSISSPQGFHDWFPLSYLLFFLVELAAIPLAARLMQARVLRRRRI